MFWTDHDTYWMDKNWKRKFILNNHFLNLGIEHDEVSNIYTLFFQPKISEKKQKKLSAYNFQLPCIEEQTKDGKKRYTKAEEIPAQSKLDYIIDIWPIDREKAKTNTKKTTKEDNNHQNKETFCEWLLVHGFLCELWPRTEHQNTNRKPNRNVRNWNQQNVETLQLDSRTVEKRL